MPLLGGACKFLQPVAAGDPRFTGDPYVVFDYEYPRPPNPIAGIEVDADGGIEKFISSGNQGDFGRWDNGIGTLNKADYQFRLDTFSEGGRGLFGASDPVDVWLPASAGLHAWWVEVDAGFTASYAGLLRVRLAVSPFTEFDSASVNLSAESTP